MEMMLIKKRMFVAIAILLCSMAMAPPGWSQALLINSINTDAYPLIKARFSAIDSLGKEYRIFSPQDIHITEFGQNVQPTFVQCPPVVPPNALSVVLAIDVSGSMERKFDDNTNLDFAKEAVRSFLHIYDYDISECGITSFNNDAFCVQDLTISKTKLLNSLEQLVPNGGTNYTNGLVQPKNGAIEIVKNGINKRVIIFLTDGVGEINFQQVLDSLTEYDITFYAIGLKMLLPKELKKLSENTDGRFYERVRTQEELIKIYKEILILEQTNSAPCEVEWISNEKCNFDEISLQIHLPLINAKATTTYRVPKEKVQSLEFSNTLINFGQKEANKKYDSIITVFARNKEFTIKSIETNSPYFSITPKITTIPKNDSVQLRLTFEPPDSLFYNTKIVISTNECNFDLFVNGGIPRETSQLKLISPNGGETYGVYSDTVIRWEGISKDEKVVLEFSTNNGKSWRTISEEATNYQYKWRAISPEESNDCLVRVSQRSKFPYPKDFTLTNSGWIHNITWSPSSSKIAICSNMNQLTILDIHTLEKKSLFDKSIVFNNVSFSPDEQYVVSCGDNNNIRVIDILTMEIKKNIVGIGNVVHVEWSPNGNYIVAINTLGQLDFFTPEGTLYKSHKLPSNSIPFVTQKKLFWSNDGKRLAYSESYVDNSDSGRVYVYDAETMEQIGYKAFSFRYIHSNFFSPDGRFITTVTDKISETWEIENSNIVKSYPYKTDFSHMSVSYNNKYVLYLWDLYRGYIPSLYNNNQDFEFRTFPKHRSTLQVYWSPNSKYFVTADWDSTLRFFVVEHDVLQLDESDSTFTTIAPNFTPIVVNMDTVEIPKYRDSVVINTMKLNTPFPILIDSVSITNDFVISLFKIIGERKDLLIEKDKLFPLEFRYNPIFRGRNEARYTYYIGDKVIATAPIIGFAIDSIFTRLASKIDMGEVQLGSSKDSLAIRTIRNVSIRHIPIRGLRIVGSNDFTLLSSPDPFTLNRTQTLQVDIRFTPSRGGLIQAMLEIEYDGPNSPLYIPIIGIGITTGEYVIEAGNVETSVGEIVDIPFTVRGRSKEGITSENLISFDVDYRSTVALPMGVTSVPFTNEISTVRMTNLPLKTGIIGEIKMRIGLGDQKVSIVGIQNITTTLPTDITSIDGSITLIDLCEEGGTRLLNPTGRTGVVALTVQNGRIELELDRAEAGTAQLSITNQIGQTVYSATLPHSEVTTSFESISTTNFSSGVYFITFSTATTNQTVPVLIIK